MVQEGCGLTLSGYKLGPRRLLLHSIHDFVKVPEVADPQLKQGTLGRGLQFSQMLSEKLFHGLKGSGVGSSFDRESRISRINFVRGMQFAARSAQPPRTSKHEVQDALLKLLKDMLHRTYL